MSEQNPYYQENPQDPYSGGQYGGQYQQQQPQTVYGSYGETVQQPPYQSVPQPAPSYQQQPYQQMQQPYPPLQSPGYAPQGAYSGTPYMQAAPQGQGSGLAIAGLVLGIVSLVLFWTLYIGIPAAIVGIVLSVLGRRDPQRRTMATVGLVLSILAIVFALCEIGLVAYGVSHPS